MTIFDSIVAKGEPADMALYTFIIIMMLRMQGKKEEQLKEEEFLKKYGNMTFEDLFKSERGDTE